MSLVSDLVEPHIGAAVQILTDHAYDKAAGHYAIIVKATRELDGTVVYTWDWYAKQLEVK